MQKHQLKNSYEAIGTTVPMQQLDNVASKQVLGNDNQKLSTIPMSNELADLHQKSQNFTDPITSRWTGTNDRVTALDIMNTNQG